MKSSFDADLAKLIHSTIRSIRNTLDSEGFTEISHPHLDPGNGVAFYSTFCVTIPNQEKFSKFKGTLLVSGSRYNVEAARTLGRVYRIGPSFRVEAEPRPNRLFECQTLHVTQEGTISDSAMIAEKILEDVVANAAPISREQAGTLRKISFPLPRITHLEATKLLKLDKDADLDLGQQMKLLELKGASALFLTNIPQSINPYAAFDHVDSDGLEQNFELVLQFGGETLVGSEYETNVETLRNQLAESLLLKSAIQLGTTKDEYAKPLIDLLARPRGPVASLYGGVNRLVQFLRPAERIEDATLFPVNAQFLLNEK